MNSDCWLQSLVNCIREHWVASGLTVGGIVTAMWKAVGPMYKAYVRWRVNQLWPKFRASLDEARTGRATPLQIAFDDFAGTMPGYSRSVLRGLWDRVAELSFATKAGDGYVLEPKPKEKPEDATP